MVEESKPRPERQYEKLPYGAGEVTGLSTMIVTRPSSASFFLMSWSAVVCAGASESALQENRVDRTMILTVELNNAFIHLNSVINRSPTV